jgi:hypothetical protein
MIDWVTEHPYQTVVHIANGVILCTPAAITAPIFSTLGFSALGPASGMSTVLPYPEVPLKVPSELISYRFGSKRSHELFRLRSSQWCLCYNPERCNGWLRCRHRCWSSAGGGCGVFGGCLGLGMEGGKYHPILKYIVLSAESLIEDCCLLSIAQDHMLERIISALPMYSLALAVSPSH